MTFIQFIQGVGIGLGIGIVHASLIVLMLVLARVSAKNREDDTLKLMKERNELDERKAEALEEIARRLDTGT